MKNYGRNSPVAVVFYAWNNIVNMRFRGNERIIINLKISKLDRQPTISIKATFTF